MHPSKARVVTYQLAAHRCRVQLNELRDLLHDIANIDVTVYFILQGSGSLSDHKVEAGRGQYP